MILAIKVQQTLYQHINIVFTVIKNVRMSELKIKQ